MRGHYPRWPTGSPDPIVNIIASGIIALIAVLAFATSFVILIPIGLIFAVIAGIRWYHYHQPAYADVVAIAGAVEQRRIVANFPDPPVYADSFAHRLIEAWHPQLPILSLFERIVDVAEQLYEMEGFNNPIPPLPSDDLIEQGRYRDLMRAHADRTKDAPHTLELFSASLSRVLTPFKDALPPDVLLTKRDLAAQAQHEPPLAVPLLAHLPTVGQVIYDMVTPLHTREVSDLRLFQELNQQLADNADRIVAPSPGLPPYEHPGAPQEIVDLYLGATPLRVLFDGNIPFLLPDEARFAGHWILSPPGRGKTTLLHAMVMADMGKPDACLILMDSKGDFIDPIRNLDGIQDRLIVIDPDPQNPVAINPLDIAQTNIAQSVDLLEYLFASLLEFKMTAMQTTLFRSVLRALVTSFPDPTLETFRDLLANGYEKYAAHIQKLPPDLRDFFANDFNERNYADRRREVLQRLRLLLDNETMRAMLTATNTRFHIGEAMDTGKIVVINNSKARLGDQGAEFFGRFFIAQVLAAAQQRSARRGDQKPPVYFYIDECQNVIARDEKIPTILDECRSQNIALIMAHQRTRQITSENVLDALSNCAIRFANSDEEARQLAPRLRTSAEFLQSLGRGKFAAFVRDETKQAIAVTVNRVDFAQHASITAVQSQMILERMRRDFGVPLKINGEVLDEPPDTPSAEADRSPLMTAPATVEPPGAMTQSPANATTARDAMTTGDQPRRAATSPGGDTIAQSEPSAKTRRPSAASRRTRPDKKSEAGSPSEGATDWR